MTYYSRRQLEALGEPLGESVTQVKPGGHGRIYGGGGSGGGGSTTSTTYTSNIPEWLRPQTEALLGAATQEYFTTKPGEEGKVDITGVKPYTPYSTRPEDYFAGFSPLQQQAQYETANLQRPGQFGAATAGAGTGMGLGYGTGMAGLGAAFTDPTQMMSPYMQGVVDVQKEAAIRDAQKAQLVQNLGAARAGTYGGARQLLATTERERALESQLGGIQARGLQDAYSAAVQRGQALGQLGVQGLGTGLQAAQQMGALGSQQQASDLQRIQAQAEMGAAQQGLEQARINQAVQNYALAQQYPYQQLAAYSGLVRGYATPTTTVSQYSAAPSYASQAAGLGLTGAAMYNLMGGGTGKKAGGSIKEKHFAEGGIAEIDQKVINDPTSFSENSIKQGIQSGAISKMAGAIALSGIENAQNQAQAYSSGNQPAPQGTVLEDLMGDSSGIEALPSNLNTVNAAGGGIIAFAGGGDTDEDDEDEDFAGTKLDRENEALAMRLLASRRAAPGMGIDALGTGLTTTSPSPRSAGIDRVAATPEVSLMPAKEESRVGLKAPSGHKYAQKIAAEAERVGLDPQFALYLASKETGGIRNPESARSSAGALGIMQLMPGTAKDMGVKDPLDPDQNIAGGVRYAKMMLDKYNDPKIAAIAYNWGPGNTDKWLKAGADMSKLPKETRNYIASLKEGGAIRFQNQGLAIDPDLQKRIDELGAQLDAARLEARAPSGVELKRDPTLSQKYQEAVKKRNELQKQYETLMETEGGLGKPLIMQPSPSGSKMVPVPHPITQQMVKSAPPTARQVAAAPIAQTATPESRALQTQYEEQDIQEGPLGRLSAPASAAQAAAAAADGGGAGAKAPNLLDQLNQLIGKREENIAKQREQDKYMALLSAGLGIMGGTSPRALENIGKGALQGVAYAQGAGKLRAAEENAILSGRLGQYRVAQNEELRRQLGEQGQEARYTQQLSNARSNMIKNIVAAKKIDIDSLDKSQLSRIEAEADAMLARDPAYQAIYKKLYGSTFAPAAMPAASVDYAKTYGLTPRTR